MPDASSNTSSAASSNAASSDAFRVSRVAPQGGRDHLEPGVAAVVALFEGPLAEHAFPGADWVTLSELEEAVIGARADTDGARAALVRAQESLVASERALVAHEAKLLARAHRALAYARVYAEDAPELASAIRAIELPALPVRAADPDAVAAQPKRRGRPPRGMARVGERPDAPLFEAPSNDTGATKPTVAVDTAHDVDAAAQPESP